MVLIFLTTSKEKGKRMRVWVGEGVDCGQENWFHQGNFPTSPLPDRGQTHLRALKG